MQNREKLTTENVRSRMEAYVTAASERMNINRADLNEIDRIANGFIESLSPGEIGFLLHDDPEPLPLSQVASDIREKYRAKYGTKNLKRGQFFRLKSGTITFFAHEHKLKFKVQN